MGGEWACRTFSSVRGVSFFVIYRRRNRIKKGREGEGCCCLRLFEEAFRWKGKETARLGGDGMKKWFFPRTKEEEDSLQIIKSSYRYLPYTINHFVHDRVETLRCTTLREHQSLWRIKHRDKASRTITFPFPLLAAISGNPERKKIGGRDIERHPV